MAPHDPPHQIATSCTAYPTHQIQDTVQITIPDSTQHIQRTDLWHTSDMAQGADGAVGSRDRVCGVQGVHLVILDPKSTPRARAYNDCAKPPVLDRIWTPILSLHLYPV